MNHGRTDGIPALATRRSRLLAATAALVLVGCKLDATLRGLGPVLVGMTVAQASTAAGVPIVPVGGVDEMCRPMPGTPISG